MDDLFPDRAKALWPPPSAANWSAETLASVKSDQKGWDSLKTHEASRAAVWGPLLPGSAPGAACKVEVWP